MRALFLVGQVLLASVFTLPGCGKGRVPPPPPVSAHGPRIGQVAPEIDGEDLDGVRFKLSDYRGKVVLLDFWGQFCPPCREFFPRERSIVHRYKDRPFVLLGVNNDEQLAVARKSVEKNKLNWRSWFDGGRPGPIGEAWALEAWPTVYLIDAEGVVRYYFCPTSAPLDENEIEDAVEKLVREVERGRKS
jgi:thiol-disulfide isomerase/thioredoxin